MKKLYYFLYAILCISLFFASSPSWSAQSANQSAKNSVSSELNGLGTNEDVMDRARALNPMNKVVVVQKRAVDRRLRLEVLGSYGGNLSGDPYLDTQTLSGQFDFHITPYVSIGGRYMSFDNDLTPEGRRVFDNAEEANETDDVLVPEIDQAQNAYLATVSVYPFYGKLSMFRSSIVQFDIYAMGGYGQIELESGTTDTYTLGGGLAAWFSNRVSARMELRNQFFEDQLSTGGRDMSWTVFTAGIGVLL